MLDMKDKVAVVTGGSSGIGLAIAEEFVARGAKVVITGRRQGALDDAAAVIGKSCTTFKGDVAVPSDVEALYAEVMARHGRLDTVIANAGAGYHSSLGSITARWWRFCVLRCPRPRTPSETGHRSAYLQWG